MTEPRKREPLSRPMIEPDWPGWVFWRELWESEPRPSKRRKTK